MRDRNHFVSLDVQGQESVGGHVHGGDSTPDSQPGERTGVCMDEPKKSMAEVLTALRKLTVPELQRRYEEVYGEPTSVKSKPYLWKRVGYRIQELAENTPPDTPEELERERQLVGMARIRWRDKPSRKGRKAVARGSRDPRLPPVGSVLRRFHDGVEHAVMVLPDGFEYQGQVYPSLTKVATMIAGTKWNGFSFFHIGAHGARRRRVDEQG